MAEKTGSSKCLLETLAGTNPYAIAQKVKRHPLLSISSRFSIKLRLQPGRQHYLLPESHQETNKGLCSNPTAAWTALICGNTTLQRSFSSISMYGLIEAVRNMENCHSCEAVSSPEPYPPQTTLPSLYQHGGMRPQSATAAPSWLLQALARGDERKAPAFINCFHRQRVSLLGESLLLQEDHVALGQLNLPSTWPEGSNVRNIVCGLLNLQRGLSWQRSIVVLWKERMAPGHHLS